MSEIKGTRAQRLLDELVEAAKSCGFEVRREKLMREVGYRARSGSCRVRERDLIILDSVQPPAEQLEVLADRMRNNYEISQDVSQIDRTAEVLAQ